ncbi:FG-GAP-like repeat-containing protein [Streptomyces sp. NPDC001514]
MRIRTRRLLSTAIAVSLTAGLAATVGGPATAAEAPPEQVVFQSDRYLPRAETLYWAGATGVLHKQEGSGLLWTRWDGTSRSVPDDFVNLSSLKVSTGSDILITSLGGGNWRALDFDAGTKKDFALPAGHLALATAGQYLVTRTGEAGAVAYHLLEWTGEALTPLRDLVVPTGIQLITTGAYAADESGVVLQSYDGGGGPLRYGILDFKTGAFALGPTTTVFSGRMMLSGDRLVSRVAEGKVRWLPRGDLQSTPREIPLVSVGDEWPVLAVAGDSLLLTWSDLNTPNNMADVAGYRLEAIPFDGGERRTLLRHAAPSLITAADGSAIVAGGEDSGQWALRRFDGAVPAPQTILDIPPLPAGVHNLSIAAGQMATREIDGSFHPSFHRRPIATEGAKLTPGVRSWIAWGRESTDVPFASGDGREYRLSSSFGSVDMSVLDPYHDTGYVRFSSESVKVVDVSGRYVIANGANPTAQYVGDLNRFSDFKPIRTRSTTPAATVWGPTYWTQSATPGTLTAESLGNGTVTTLKTGATCLATDLQAVGRWLYWACGTTGPAGVWDLKAKKNVPVPAGEALIGDGYLVRHDRAAGKLLLTGFRDGTADDTRVIGDMPDTGASTRGQLWTVDKFGGPAAFVAPDKKIHLVPSGVETEPLAPIQSHTDTVVRPTSDYGAWKGQWQMNRPMSSWQVVIRNNATGAVVRTFSGGPHSAMDVQWDGFSATGGHLPSGYYTWTLTAQPANGQGAAFTATGSIRRYGGPAQRHDHVGAASIPDGNGDLLALTPAGSFDFWHGTGTGRVSGKTSGAGWPAGVSAVPFGDVNGDACNDVLVRMPGGELRAYKPACGKPLTPSVPYTKAGSGFGGLNVLTSPGDLTGDGRADLIGRSGDGLYLFAGRAGGAVASAVKLGSGWSSFTHIVGVGDLNGDGAGDLVARKSDGSVYRYDGTGTGRLKAGVKILSGWGGSYTSIVGVGDVTGDAKPDLIARDRAGLLFRMSGDGQGSFGPAVQIGTGWATMKGLF